MPRGIEIGLEMGMMLWELGLGGTMKEPVLTLTVIVHVCGCVCVVVMQTVSVFDPHFMPSGLPLVFPLSYIFYFANFSYVHLVFIFLFFSSLYGIC